MRPALETASLTSELFKKSPCCSSIGAWAMLLAFALDLNLRYAMRKLGEGNLDRQMQKKQQRREFANRDSSCTAYCAG